MFSKTYLLVVIGLFASTSIFSVAAQEDAEPTTLPGVRMCVQDTVEFFSQYEVHLSAIREAFDLLNDAQFDDPAMRELLTEDNPELTISEYLQFLMDVQQFERCSISAQDIKRYAIVSLFNLMHTYEIDFEKLDDLVEAYGDTETFNSILEEAGLERADIEEFTAQSETLLELDLSQEELLNFLVEDFLHALNENGLDPSVLNSVQGGSFFDLFSSGFSQSEISFLLENYGFDGNLEEFRAAMRFYTNMGLDQNQVNRFLTENNYADAAAYIEANEYDTECQTVLSCLSDN
jgi:hypothetical protein